MIRIKKIRKLAEQTGLRPETIKSRLRHGKSIKEAIKEPVSADKERLTELFGLKV